MKKRVKGLYQRPDSGVYWCSYQAADGRRRRESLGTSDRGTAEKLFLDKLGRLARGEKLVHHADKVTLAELAEDLVTEYETNARRSLDRVQDAIAHLLRGFGAQRAQQLTTADIRLCVAQRQKQGAANATINRELAALKRMYTLAMNAGRLHHRPHIEMLREDNVRQGFFERDQFDAVRAHLPEYARPVVTFAYITGWRLRSEILALEWHQVDFKAGTVRLEPGTTKNRDGRTFVMTPELRACLEVQRVATDTFQRERGRIVRYVFHRQGERIRGFRKAWATACRLAGVPDRIPHDFRRTAVRNLERAGVPRSVAMKMVGHKTEAIYRRYAIVDEAMLRDAAERLARLGG